MVSLESLSLQPKVRKEIDELTVNNIGQWEAILQHSFATPPTAKWLDYRTSLAYFNDISVGGISSEQQSDTIVISALCVLPAYRRFGLASKLIESLISHERDRKPDLLETKPLYVSAVVPKNAVELFEKLDFVKGTTSKDGVQMKLTL